MRRPDPVLVVCALGVLTFAGGCGGWYRYPPFKVASQPELPVQQIQQAQEFAVRIDTSKVALAFLEFAETREIAPAQGALIIASFHLAFHDAFARTTREEGIRPRLTPVNEQARVTTGILVDVVVTHLLFKELEITDKKTGAVDTASVLPDQFHLTITFTDQANNVVLYRGEIETTNYSTDPKLRWRGIPGRMTDGAANIAWVVTNIMKNGKFVPARTSLGITGK